MNAPFTRADRRSVLKLLAATGLIAGPTLVTSRSSVAAADEQPMFFTWPSYDNPALYPAYVEKYGEPPRFTLWGDEEEGVSKLVSGFRPDVLFPCSYKIGKWYQTGLIDAIDVSKLSHWPELIPAFANLAGVTQDGNVVWIPVDWGQTSVIYRTDLAPEYEANESYAILWDPKYRKRVAAFDSLVDAVVLAGLMAGIPDMFDYRNDADLEKTRVKTRELADQVRFFSNDPTTIEQGLASGEVVAATVWNESYLRLKKQGVAVKYMNPKEGRLTWVCGLSILKGTSFRDKAHEVIDAMLDVRSRLWEMENFGYGASTATAYAQMGPEKLAELGQALDPMKVIAGGIVQKEIQGEDRLQAMFDEVKSGL